MSSRRLPIERSSEERQFRHVHFSRKGAVAPARGDSCAPCSQAASRSSAERSRCAIHPRMRTAALPKQEHQNAQHLMDIAGTRTWYGIP